MPETAPIGVLLMAYGGPETMADIPGYLADIRDGRPTPGRVLDEISANYDAIGGRSPLREHTERQASALSSLLAERGGGFRVYVGMRHAAPWIEDTVLQMIDDGVDRAISLVLAPQFSSFSVARYQAKIGAGLQMYRGAIEFLHVDSYHDAPGLVEAFADRVRLGLSYWPEDVRGRVHVVFSAHSLPARLARSGDPYDHQAKETAQLVATRAGLPDDVWSWSYQSAGRSDEAWLGPSLREHLASLADRRIGDVLVVPVGFVSDHVELLFDVDIDARRLAGELGMRLERPPALNDHAGFVLQLADLIERRAAGARWI